MGWPSGWIEWSTAVQTALTVLAFPLGVIAFFYGRKQLRETRSAAEAASQAAMETQGRLLRSRLMMHLHLVRQVEADLIDCRRDNDVMGASRTLRRWRIISATTAAILDEIGSEMGPSVVASIEMARIAEAGLNKATGVVDVTRRTRQITEEVSTLSDQMTAAAENIATARSTELEHESTKQQADSHDHTATALDPLDPAVSTPSN